MTPGHRAERLDAEVPVRPQAVDHARELLLAVGERGLRGDLRERRRVRDEELVQLRELRSDVGRASTSQPTRQPVMQ